MILFSNNTEHVILTQPGRAPLSKQGSLNNVIEMKWSSRSFVETSHVGAFTVLLAQLHFMLGQCGWVSTGCSVKDTEKAGISVSFG